MIARQLLVAPDFIPHWAEELTDEQYHADKTAIGSNSLRTAMDSLKRFYGEMFLGKSKPENDAMVLGRKIHMAILEREKFNKLHLVMPEFTGLTQKGELSMQSKEAKEKRAKWLIDLPQGAVPVTVDELEMMTGIAESIIFHPHGPHVIKDAVPERAGYYFDRETGLRLKIKPDLLRTDGIAFTDLKTTKSSKKDFFIDQIFGDLRIDIQLFMYGKGIEELCGQFPPLTMVLAAEKLWPYETAIYRFNREDLSQAEMDYHSTLRAIRKAIDDDFWPQRQMKMERCSAPQWFMWQANERNEKEVL